MESVNEFARLCGGIEPVSVKAAHAESRICLREGCGKAPAVIFRKIEIIHGAGDVEIAVCIETIDEADPLMPQIAFHLKICVEAEAFRNASLQPTPELLRQASFGQIRYVSGLTTNDQTSGGRDAFVIINADTTPGHGLATLHPAHS